MKDAYYFSHDSNARNDPKIKALRRKYGLSGYATFWIVIEMLREADEYKLPYKQYIFDCLAEEINDGSTDVQQMLNDLISEFELLKREDDYFWSESLLRRMKKMDQQKERARLAGLKSAEKRASSNGRSTSVQPSFNGCSTIKEKKGKEIKIKGSRSLASSLDEKEIINHDDAVVTAAAFDKTKYDELEKLNEQLKGKELSTNANELEAIYKILELGKNNMEYINGVIQNKINEFKESNNGTSPKSIRYFLPIFQQLCYTAQGRAIQPLTIPPKNVAYLEEMVKRTKQRAKEAANE